MRSARLRVEWGDYDLACLDVGQSLQLYLKAVIMELFGLETRTHGILEHLAILRRELDKAGYTDLAILISDIVREKRSIIDLIDESYIMARYALEPRYQPEDAMRAINLAESIIEVLEKVRREVRSSG